jgi:hypothetical protein
MKQDPKTPEQWQEAADAAHVLLLVDSARWYGLIDGGPLVDVERCQSLLKQARSRGVTPALDAVQRLLPAMIRATP